MALTSAIIMSVILITVTLSLSTTGFFARFNILEGEYKDRSTALAEGCVEHAMLEIALDPDYVGGGPPIMINGDLCTIELVTASGDERTVRAQGIFQNVYTNLEVTVDTAPTIDVVTAWKEIANMP